MMWVRYPDDGSVIEGDDATRVALVDGTPRPYTAKENEAADALEAAARARAEHEAARVTVRAIITDLQAERTRAQEVIDAAASTQEDRKNARAILRTAGAAIALARLVRDL